MTASVLVRIRSGATRRIRANEVHLLPGGHFRVRGVYMDAPRREVDRVFLRRQVLDVHGPVEGVRDAA